MSDEIDNSQIDWSQLLDLEGGGPRIFPIATPDAVLAYGDHGPSHWLNTSYGEGHDSPALPTSLPDVDPVLQPPEHSAIRNQNPVAPPESDIFSEWDWMSGLNTGLPNSVGFPNGQPIVPVPGLPAAPGGELPHALTTPSPYQYQAITNGTASDFDFVSGCRPIGGIAQPISERGVEAGSLTCIWPGCSSKRTFKRTYELQRHMKKHLSLARYHCMVANCPLKKTTAFYRLDKFRDHLRNSHSQHDLVTCPVPTCTTGPLPLFLFITHVYFHTNSKTNRWYHLLHAFQEADPRGTIRPCPFDGCRKWLAFGDVPAHLRTHELEDLMKHKDEIAEAGYDIPSAHLICPVCNQRSADHYGFKEHFTLHHLTLDAEHFTAWRTAYLLHSFRIDALIPWEGWRTWGCLRNSGVVCPACGLEEGRYGTESTHHLGLLAPTDWINQSLQEKILNLWPGFITHPIFDSILPTVGGIGGFI